MAAFGLFLGLLTAVTTAFGSGVKNIMGGELTTCSQPGMAMTGFTRDGRCADVGPADAGAHHVCIRMKADFCHVTGQPNWCTTRNFPCMGKSGNCPIGNWCVCQWAFSRYLQKAGGCDSIVDLVCDATNMAAFEAYARSNSQADKAALECMKKRCGFYKSEANDSISEMPQLSRSLAKDSTYAETVTKDSTSVETPNASDDTCNFVVGGSKEACK
jgi:uncharacterized protein (DUF2237 family)